MLYIVHSYSSFQKDQIESMSPYFEICNVFVRSNPVAEISNYFHVPYLERYKLSSKIDKTNLPSNINIFNTPLLYFPYDKQYKKLGSKHLKKVNTIIKNRNLNFDMIHAHFTWSAGYVGAKLKEKYDVPFVVTAHGYDIYELPFKDKEWRTNIEYVLNAADAIITVSESNSKYIKKLGVDTPVHIVPNGYRRDLFYQMDMERSRNKLNLPHDKKIILTVGNLVDVKGHKYLIEAMGHITKHRSDVMCVIVGSGKLETQLRKKITDMNLEDHVRLIGSKPHNEIPVWMNACDVFVLPSLNESFGVVIVEAMACGKPVVASAVGGITEIITNNSLGVLCKPEDIRALTDALEQAFDKDWNRDVIRTYAERYSLEEIGKEIIRIYKTVMD